MHIQAALDRRDEPISRHYREAQLNYKGTLSKIWNFQWKRLPCEVRNITGSVQTEVG